MFKTINSSDECLFVERLFNKTILNFTFLRRIKYYHLPCQNAAPQLSCFYDEQHICLCQQLDNQQRVTNCLKFNHNATFNYRGQSGCLHDGQCFQENTTCSRISVCKCPICYYGPRCQLNTNGYSLSLDAILGYHIQQNINIVSQSKAVLISLLIVYYV